MQTRKHDAAMPYNAEQDDGSFIGEFGLTKREFFAAAALQGILSSPKPMPDNAEVIAVKMADLIINELNKTDVRGN